MLKDSALFDALLAAYHGGGVLAASGAGATVLCDPMVDPRGGAYTVGLGVGARTSRCSRTTAPRPTTSANARSTCSRATAMLVGIDEETALIKRADGWTVAGAGAVTLYGIEGTPTYTTGDAVAGLPA